MPRLRPSRFMVLGAAAVLLITYYALQPRYALPSSWTDVDAHARGVGDADDLSGIDAETAALLQQAELGYGMDGLVRGWDRAHELLRMAEEGEGDGVAAGLEPRVRRRLESLARRHPIEALIERGRERWEGLMARQSRTLAQAVKRYQERYRRPPPKGFDDWWRFCRDNDVKIVDDYDQIDRDLEPYFAMSPTMFRKRAVELFDTPHTYHINLDPHNVSMSGDRADSARGHLFMELIRPLAPLLPLLPAPSSYPSDSSQSQSQSPIAVSPAFSAFEPLVMHASDHDLGSWMPGEDQLAAARQAVKEGRYIPEGDWAPFEVGEGRSEVRGTLSVCEKGSRGWEVGMRRARGEEVDLKEGLGLGYLGDTTFIHDAYPTYDFCNHPSHLALHGALSFDFARITKLRPILQLSKFSRNRELLMTPLLAYHNASHPKSVAVHVLWGEKSVSKLFWRGTPTGDAYSKREGDWDWRWSHRVRMGLMAQAQEGDVGVWVQRGGAGTGVDGEDEDEEREAGVWRREQWNRGELNEAYMDVGLNGFVVQCDEEDGTCDEMKQELKFREVVSTIEAGKYKYILDIDGNGWSSRFHRLMISGSVVLKSTIHPEWMSDWMIPWYHYVVDYSDVYSIMSYFVGPPDGSGRGNDAQARAIAEQSRQFTLEHWRWEDMQAYMYRLLLEYTRLMAEDRDAWVYKK